MLVFCLLPAIHSVCVRPSRNRARHRGSSCSHFKSIARVYASGPYVSGKCLLVFLQLATVYIGYASLFPPGRHPVSYNLRQQSQKRIQYFHRPKLLVLVLLCSAKQITISCKVFCVSKLSVSFQFWKPKDRLKPFQKKIFCTVKKKPRKYTWVRNTYSIGHV